MRVLKDEEEFDPVLFQNALCDGLFFWEGELEKAALGKNPDVNIAALQMAMRHKFGWDKSDAHASDETKEAMAHFASVTRFLEKKGSLICSKALRSKAFKLMECLSL